MRDTKRIMIRIYDSEHLQKEQDRWQKLGNIGKGLANLLANALFLSQKFYTEQGAHFCSKVKND